MAFNSGLGMERSYYVATANPFAPAPKLEGEVVADVVIIGGGYTGLHTALNAAERGFSVVYKGFGHGINKPKERLAALWHNWQWFNKYIWGEEVEMGTK